MRYTALVVRPASCVLLFVSRMSVVLWGVLGTKLDKLCPDLRVIGVATRIQLGLGVVGVATGARSFC